MPETKTGTATVLFSRITPPKGPVTAREAQAGIFNFLYRNHTGLLVLYVERQRLIPFFVPFGGRLYNHEL
jgi:hypothetical protein